MVDANLSPSVRALRAPLREADCEAKLASNFSQRKKWSTVCIIMLVQISMNMNASIYGNAVHDLRSVYGVSELMSRSGFSIFLCAYAFGCELWAPWSEESGRWKTLQWSLFFVNLWQIPQIFLVFFGNPAHGKAIMAAILVLRFLGGLSSAGGSITLGMVADMWDSEDQQKPMAYVVWASNTGSIVGPVLGGFLEYYVGGFWVFPAQLIAGVLAQALHYFFCAETRSRAIVKREARGLRRKGENVRSIYEVGAVKILSREGLKYAAHIWARPFQMFYYEPIVLFLSLISGFSDALIFTFLESLPMVMGLWGFNSWQKGLCFVPIFIGYIVGLGIWLMAIRRRKAKIAQNDEKAKMPESRLCWLLYTAPLLPLAIFPFAWTGTGPPMPWIVPLVFLIFIGIANYAIYGSTVDYMVATYGDKYAASATGGNGFSRDLLAGISAYYVKPLFSNIGSNGKHLQLASTLLGCIAVVLIIPIYVFYCYGEKVRALNFSKFAKEVTEDRKRNAGLPVAEVVQEKNLSMYANSATTKTSGDPLLRSVTAMTSGTMDSMNRVL